MSTNRPPSLPRPNWRCQRPRLVLTWLDRRVMPDSLHRRHRGTLPGHDLGDKK